MIAVSSCLIPFRRAPVLFFEYAIYIVSWKNKIKRSLVWEQKIDKTMPPNQKKCWTEKDDIKQEKLKYTFETVKSIF